MRQIRLMRKGKMKKGQEMWMVGALAEGLGCVIGFYAWGSLTRFVLKSTGMIYKPGEFGKHYTAAQVGEWAEDVRRRNEIGALSAKNVADASIDGHMSSFLENSLKRCMDRHHDDVNGTAAIPSGCEVHVLFLAESLKKAGRLPTTTK